VDTFLVAFLGGYWRIGYQDHWYGSYADKRTAKRMAVTIARAYGELPTRVAVRETNGAEEVIWNPLTDVTGHTNVGGER
jgi:hypothetical protein